jgi:glycerol-3-phosphate acyltransferase PlsY
MTDLASPNALLALVLGYLLGSIPFGLILTRLAGFGDIRAIGSGNIGATNVLRTGNKALAAATLLGDGLKGTAAALIAGAWLGPVAAMVAGFGAFVGHVFPVWLQFRGGKGVATFLGVLAGLAWPVAVGFAIVWVAMALIFRISSLAALTASLLTPIALLMTGRTGTAVLFVVLTVILWARHEPNIRRLLSGTESRIGEKK